jgi:hypothetical protein
MFSKDFDKIPCVKIKEKKNEYIAFGRVDT